jgi:Fur family transcriptional regulator, ferric uptake regulator
LSWGPSQSRRVRPIPADKHLPKRRTTRPASEETGRVWKTFLVNKGLNASKTRDDVVAVFLETTTHIDLQSLHEAVRRRHPGIGFATVYRTMKLLEDAGLAHARRFGDAKETLYEVAAGRSHHDHLICESCGKIVEFVSPEVERLQDGIAVKHGFELNRHRHELYGRCGECRA